MEHEFVPGKRRCRACWITEKQARHSIEFAKWCDVRSDMPEPKEPPSEPSAALTPEPQTWHLNIWTSVNGVIFTGSHQYSGPDVIGWAQTEAANKVKEIVAGYTAEETE